MVALHVRLGQTGNNIHVLAWAKLAVFYTIRASLNKFKKKLKLYLITKLHNDDY